MYRPSHRMQVPRRRTQRRAWICARATCGDLSRLSSFTSPGLRNSMKLWCSRAAVHPPTFRRIGPCPADWRVSFGPLDNRQRLGAYWCRILKPPRWGHRMIWMRRVSPLGPIAPESASQVVFFRPGPPCLDADRLARSESGNEQQRDAIDDFDQRVDRRARRVFIRIANRVTRDRGLVGS